MAVAKAISELIKFENQVIVESTDNRTCALQNNVFATIQFEICRVTPSDRKFCRIVQAEMRHENDCRNDNDKEETLSCYSPTKTKIASQILPSVIAFELKPGEFTNSSTSNSSSGTTSEENNKNYSLTNIQLVPCETGIFIWRPRQEHHFFLRLSDLLIVQLTTECDVIDVCVVCSSEQQQQVTTAAYCLTSNSDIEAFNLGRVTPALDAIRSYRAHLTLPNPLCTIINNNNNISPSHVNETQNANNNNSTTINNNINVSTSSFSNYNYTNSPTPTTNKVSNLSLSQQLIGDPSIHRFSSSPVSSPSSGSKTTTTSTKLRRNLHPLSFCVLPTHERLIFTPNTCTFLIHASETNDIFTVALPTVEELPVEVSTSSSPCSLDEKSSSSSNILTCGRIFSEVCKHVPMNNKNTNTTTNNNSSSSTSKHLLQHESFPIAMHCCISDVQAGTYCLTIARRFGNSNSSSKESSNIEMYLFSEHCILKALADSLPTLGEKIRIQEEKYLMKEEKKKKKRQEKKEQQQEELLLEASLKLKEKQLKTVEEEELEILKSAEKTPAKTSSAAVVAVAATTDGEKEDAYKKDENVLQETLRGKNCGKDDDDDFETDEDETDDEEDEEEEEDHHGSMFLYHTMPLISPSCCSLYTQIRISPSMENPNIFLLSFTNVLESSSSTSTSTPNNKNSSNNNNQNKNFLICIPVFEKRRKVWAITFDTRSISKSEIVPVLGANLYPPSPLCCPVPSSCETVIGTDLLGFFEYERKNNNKIHYVRLIDLCITTIYASLYEKGGANFSLNQQQQTSSNDYNNQNNFPAAEVVVVEKSSSGVVVGMDTVLSVSSSYSSALFEWTRHGFPNRASEVVSSSSSASSSSSSFSNCLTALDIIEHELAAKYQHLMSRVYDFSSGVSSLINNRQLKFESQFQRACKEAHEELFRVQGVSVVRNTSCQLNEAEKLIQTIRSGIEQAHAAMEDTKREEKLEDQMRVEQLLSRASPRRW